MDFPQTISLTITNSCNLRCQMCGQWSAEGYMHSRSKTLKHEMTLADWQRVIDELADHHIPSLLLRGGEPFLFPKIVELLEYIHAKGIFISIDTNGTRIAKYAEDIARIGGIHLTISLDGTGPIHDQVRGVRGTFAHIREGLVRLKECEQKTGSPISKSFNFTISPYSIHGLGDLPETVRGLGVDVIAIVPYYYFPRSVGEAYERVMQAEFGLPAYSWLGFHHEDSGVDFALFQQEYRKYRSSLGGIYDYPYMAFTEDEYRAWFADARSPVGRLPCASVERLIDIQPDGSVNFCVDFPDYTFGNVKEAAIAELWNSERAERFRAYRRRQPLPVCYRCGAKYMAETVG